MNTFLDAFSLLGAVASAWTAMSATHPVVIALAWILCGANLIYPVRTALGLRERP